MKDDNQYPLSCHFPQNFLLEKKPKLSQGISLRGRFTGQPSIRNVMSGILLNAGPIATQLSVRKISQTFVVTVTKAKFEKAAQRLQAANLGRVVQLRTNSSVFIKWKPEKMHHLLALPENADLCTVEEYTTRYYMASPASIKEKTKAALVELGEVAADAFQ